GTVGADRQRADAQLLVHREDPTYRAARHQDDEDAGPLEAAKHRNRPGADGPVLADQGAVQIRRDQFHSLNIASRYLATPSSSLVSVVSSASARSWGWALATATREKPAQRNIGMSLGMSPKTRTSVGSMPRAVATTIRPVA